MRDELELFREILDRGQLQVSGRAIIFDSSRRRILVERYAGSREPYVYFPGGRIELGETLQECIAREMDEEIAGTVREFEFLFLVENFIPFEGQYLHGIELFCEIVLEAEEVEAQLPGYESLWLEVGSLHEVDLRPTVVRDRIIDGTYRNVRHLVTRG